MPVYKTPPFNTPPELGTFWFGGSLGLLDQLCLKSMLAMGHKVTLYSFNDVNNVPKGVEHEDAHVFQNQPRVFLHEREQSIAPHADEFRILMMMNSDKIWVDSDMLLLKPIEKIGDHLFAYEPRPFNGVNLIGNSILSLPRTSKILENLQARFDKAEHRICAPGSPHSLRSKFGIDLAMQLILLGGPSCDLGPVALTDELTQSEMISHALPSHSYYPFAPWPIRRILRRVSVFEGALHSETRGVHLWAGRFRGLLKRRQASGEDIIPKGSYLWHKCQEYDVEIKI